MYMQANLDEIIRNEKQIITDLLQLSDGTEIVLNTTGWDSRVYIIGSGKIVFKFPRTDEARKAYRQEIEGYKLISAIQSDVSFPKILLTHPDNNYLCYEGIVGEALENVVGALTTQQRTKIGKSLGIFLKQLHTYQHLEFQIISLEKEIDDLKQKYEQGLPEIIRQFSKVEQSKIQKLVTDIFPTQITELGMNQGFCHGDLGYWNIIYGPDGQVGIIDFGDLGYYDVSKDFLGMNEEEVLNAALFEYGDNAQIRQKITIRQRVLPLLELPYFVKQQDDKMISKTIDKIRQVIQQIED